jgi:hypothetical protein
MTAAQPQTAYMGREIIGAVTVRGGAYVASNAAGRKLGSFATAKMALAAIAQAKPKTATIH